MLTKHRQQLINDFSDIFTTTIKGIKDEKYHDEGMLQILNGKFNELLQQSIKNFATTIKN